MAFTLNRRAVLKGIGIGLALPALDCMLDDRGLFYGVGQAASVAAPIRYLGFMIQNGPPKQYWNPTKNSDGSWKLASGLASIAHLQADINQITGLHARGLNSFFAHTDGQYGYWTGYPCHSTQRDNRPVAGAGPSVEQLLGQKLAQGATLYPSLATSLPRGRCDRYNDTGKNTWIADNQANAYQYTPQMLAGKLLGQVNTDELRRRGSILDFYLASSNRLAKRLGATDKARLDQHLTAVREIEQQLNATRGACSPYTAAIPAGVPADETAMPVMAALINFAFQCDLTRYVLFELANAPPQTMGGDSMDDHTNSHMPNSPLNLYYIDKKMKYWAMILDGMKASVEGDKTILYNSVSLLGCDIAVGYLHNFDDMPIVTVGQAGGRLKTGQVLTYNDVTYNNLHATLLTAAGLNTPRFGVDGTGMLPNLLNA